MTTATKITINPISRLEGHGKVTIHLDQSGEVDEAFFHITQFRGYEQFCQGRPFEEMPIITQRICGICPVSHQLASAKACDAICGVQIPETATLLRELLHMGQYIQSHALHFFHLASPDLLLGWDSDPAKRNIIGVIEAAPDLARKGIRLRKFGQDIISALGGKKVHPVFAVPGGVANALPESAGRSCCPVSRRLSRRPVPPWASSRLGRAPSRRNPGICQFPVAVCLAGGRPGEPAAV